MDRHIKEKFLESWEKYFPRQELPLAWYYTNEKKDLEPAPQSDGWRCLICDLGMVRGGKSLMFSADTIGCPGGQWAAGFIQEMGENFEYFLSCGIPGRMEGLRYKKTPELVTGQYANISPFTAPGKFLVFKRWDRLDESDAPQVVVFFANPDTISGLYTLAGFDDCSPDSVIAPFGAGCGTIIHTPYQELVSGSDRAILGMFDISARPCVPRDRLTFAVTRSRFERMLANMDDSFLITESWAKVRARL